MCKPHCSSIYGSLLIYLPQRQKLLITMIFSYIPSWFAWFVYRCSRSDVFCKKGILRNFGKLTGKHLRQRLFLIKWQVYDPQFIKKETLAQVFSSEFSEISKNTTKYLWWLLLSHRFYWTGCSLFENYTPKHLPGNALPKSCSEKFLKIHKETPIKESAFNKIS